VSGDASHAGRLLDEIMRFMEANAETELTKVKAVMLRKVA